MISYTLYINPKKSYPVREIRFESGNLRFLLVGNRNMAAQTFPLASPPNGSLQLYELILFCKFYSMNSRIL